MKALPPRRGAPPTSIAAEGVAPADLGRVVVAYEPIWAIGVALLARSAGPGRPDPSSNT